MRPPFEVVSCSWPRPIERDGNRWISDPEWDAPLLPTRPSPRLTSVDKEIAWLFDWRVLLSRGSSPIFPTLGSAFRNFHLVLSLRMTGGGALTFFADDGCIIRRNGTVVHEDRDHHGLSRAQIDVEAGDLLEIAHWQDEGAWLWAAALDSTAFNPRRDVETLLTYLPRVRDRLRAPNGPALKLFISGHSPVRAAASIYSLILNGYSPERVLLFGNHDWTGAAWRTLTTSLPFAEIVPTRNVLERVTAAGGETLVTWARQSWVVMKTLSNVFTPPSEFCAIDDDLFTLARLDEELRAFSGHDVIYTQDWNHGDIYAEMWGDAIPDCPRPVPTGSFNAGFFFLRQRHRLADLISWAQQVEPPEGNTAWKWEQGFIAAAFAAGPFLPLSTARHLQTMIDGLPGGIVGYDYRNNPSGFSTVHFGGTQSKPNDRETLLLLPELFAER